MKCVVRLGTVRQRGGGVNFGELGVYTDRSFLVGEAMLPGVAIGHNVCVVLRASLGAASGELALTSPLVPG